MDELLPRQRRIVHHVAEVRVVHLREKKRLRQTDSERSLTGLGGSPYLQLEMVFNRPSAHAVQKLPLQVVRGSFILGVASRLPAKSETGSSVGFVA